MNEARIDDWVARARVRGHVIPSPRQVLDVNPRELRERLISEHVPGQLVSFSSDPYPITNESTP